MNLTSNIFLFIFFPLTFGLYFIIPSKVKKYYLLIISLFFYAIISLQGLAVLLITILMNYLLGLCIGKFRYKKTILVLGIILNLLLLIIYKYIGFIVENTNNIFHINLPLINLILPLGISFYTFQNLSYLVDIYKKKITVEKNIINFSLYICFYPRVTNGPIVRYGDFVKELDNLKKPKLNNIYEGIKRICFGLGKVCIIANVLGKIWTEIQGAANLYSISIATAWFGIICYSFYLYFNFSGYIDISIGLSKMYGINLPENFNYPYYADSISDFWRRWHISLSNWFRDYVYIPLGGNRKGNVYFNLMIVFILTGIWHGADWNFLLWGIYNGIFIVVERFIRDKKMYKKIPQTIKRILTYIIIIIGWVLFTNDINSSINYYKFMFGLNKIEYVPFGFKYFITPYNLFFIGISILACLPVLKNIKIKNEKLKEYLSGIFALLILLIAILFLVNNSYQPSLYANF